MCSRGVTAIAPPHLQPFSYAQQQDGIAGAKTRPVTVPSAVLYLQ